MDQEFGVSTLVEEEFEQRRQVKRLSGGHCGLDVLIPGLGAFWFLTWFFACRTCIVHGTCRASLWNMPLILFEKGRLWSLPSRTKVS